ncbi:hypothetical protein LTR78_005821 [Recurvomyces mirabilis]|uniref:Uncharacterized protein n=1 Tax=Recurvomyces mirabilis TaxID=574656 RepID=A0AAE1C151_9PEZI|nr:hypothetical protein LTR78_005821 [Recurvomyces mirabilis]KAK5154201.1 hypothetical protein LTS14_006886 [Recurvomyces mirabilis]
MRLQAQAMALPIQPKLCKEARHSCRLVAQLDNVGPHVTWSELWPRYATHCAAAANEAVAALTKALEYNRGQRTAADLAVAALASHGTAIRPLQTDLKRSECQETLDSAVVCTAALAIFQIVMNDNSKGRRANTFAHWAGMHAITQAKQSNREESEIVRAILYSFSDGLSGLAVLRGTSLCMEKQDWANMQPASLHPVQSDVLKFRTTEYHLQLQLPRLLCETRTIREKDAITSQSLNAILELALKLYQASEDEAETAVLRRAAVVGAAEDSIVPFILRFATKDDLLVALIYWHTRLVIINCCLRIVQEGHLIQAVDEARLQSDRDRTYMNVLMSREHAASTNSFAAAIVAKGFTQGWQHLRSCETWRGLRCGIVIDWILPRMASPSLAYLEAPVLTVAQLDLAADMLQGGPLYDFLASDRLPI